jgi:hypothetical protein
MVAVRTINGGLLLYSPSTRPCLGRPSFCGKAPETAIDTATSWRPLPFQMLLEGEQHSSGIFLALAVRALVAARESAPQ